MNVPKPSVGMLPYDRLAYSAISKRKRLTLPNGARMVVWTITNVEEWDPTQTDAAHGAHATGRRVADARISRTGAGTNTAIASASGGCSTSTTSSRFRA